MTLVMATKPETSDSLATLTPTRRHPRFAVAGRIRCEIQGPDMAVTLLNVSRGGFLVRSPLKARVGDVQRYRFLIETEHHYIFVLRGQVVHCAEATRGSGTTYLTGLQFIDIGTPVWQRAIEHLVDAIRQ
jgi:PilZ domain-containing protein